VIGAIAMKHQNPQKAVLLPGLNINAKELVVVTMSSIEIVPKIVPELVTVLWVVGNVLLGVVILLVVQKISIKIVNLGNFVKMEQVGVLPDPSANAPERVWPHQ
jgi:hypothetical protein